MDYHLYCYPEMKNTNLDGWATLHNGHGPSLATPYMYIYMYTANHRCQLEETRNLTESYNMYVRIYLYLNDNYNNTHYTTLQE